MGHHPPQNGKNSCFDFNQILHGDQYVNVDYETGIYCDVIILVAIETTYEITWIGYDHGLKVKIVIYIY